MPDPSVWRTVLRVVFNITGPSRSECVSGLSKLQAQKISSSVSSNMKALRPAPIITNRNTRPKRLCNWRKTTRQLPCAMVPSMAAGNHCHHKSQKYEAAHPSDHDSMLHRPRFLEQDEWGQRHLVRERQSRAQGTAVFHLRRRPKPAGC